MKKSFLVVLMIWLIPSILCASCRNIVVVGDSLSAAHNLTQAAGWVSLLQKRVQKNNPGFCVVNASVGADTTQDGLAKLPTILKDHQPVIVIIELGGNDGLRGLPVSTMRQNLSAMVSVLQQNKIEVLLLGVRMPPNYGPEYTEEFQNMYRALAKQYDVALVPQVLRGIAENPSLMQSDGIHPTAEAQQKLLDNVWPALQSVLNKVSDVKR